MFSNLPGDPREALDWTIDEFRPYAEDLLSREITPDTAEQWLRDWTALAAFASEVLNRVYVATTLDTTDTAAAERFERFNAKVMPELRKYEFRLTGKFVASRFEPEGFTVPLKHMRKEIELFREDNLPLFTQESKLTQEYDRVIGAQTVEWEGAEVTLRKLEPVLAEPNRERREKAWRLTMERRLADHAALNEIWKKFMALRGQIARNAGYDNYLDYRWRAMGRFDYTPENSVSFQNAIEEVVVPAAQRLYARQQQRLGLSSLRPWDLEVDAQNREALRPYTTTEQLEQHTESIFSKVDPQLGAYFSTMRADSLLDLDNRKGKAPGGYCTDFAVVKRPFIFMNAVGIHDDVQTLLHEGGHAFHVFESAALPYVHQMNVPMEFAEVESMSMELLGAPYLGADQGGLYDAADAVRARVQHLENLIRFWPYMAVVDAFQHWVYANHEAASDPANCDAKWAELWDRFMVGIDYSGLEDIKKTGWHRKLHIFQVPLYYVEYGLAQLGAVQVWANSLKNQSAAVAHYRKALSLGGTATLPELFEAAGARFAFDAGTLAEAVRLVEDTINALDPA